jgi:hypothetical protein
MVSRDRPGSPIYYIHIYYLYRFVVNSITLFMILMNCYKYYIIQCCYILMYLINIKMLRLETVHDFYKIILQWFKY